MSPAFRVELPPDDAQLASLRRSLAEWLDRVGVESGASTIVIQATHEAAANAIEHAQAQVLVTGCRLQDNLTVAVTNPGGWKEPTISDGRGRGLALMRALMSSVDVASDRGGTVVTMQLVL